MAKAADPTAAFFEELATRTDEPLLRKATGATQLEIVDGRTCLLYTSPSPRDS